ncbi:nucleotidyltransferase domain-containing protein [Paenibacillus alvei]|uniref:nucleotidyltransferase domain-containing protein n=1 Tax=Paenibacillus alvei TaxID=44250 RepID=UPI0018CDB84A|nr:nucleotidyltransferase domain-containing protein [Paenibacillus alvei]MBG9735504.1 hypothetical protein [Paenibacillus alvei]MBG9746765.1 hypothetical protein [Paenibacillus alvei]MCY9578552.1 DUF4111 domain-containing protein [Paenibacillus alvei]MCY9584873.1 DUF4111 domain-containing protein [Paenibacillus alvei]
MKLRSEIADILEQYVQLIHAYKQDWLEGLYIYGSIALGDYSLALSDIDFIAITRARLHEEEISKLNDIHAQVNRFSARPNMNGIYITWDDIGKLPKDVAPFPYYCDGKMKQSGYFELNLVTWYELKQHGIAILGPPVSELDIAFDMDAFLNEMHENLNRYWARWIRSSKPFYSIKGLLLLNRAQIAWGVLGVTRQWYTFRERAITSKAGAGEYALLHVPECWHPILQESINQRKGVRESLYASKWKRKRDALAYMDYITKECNQFVASLSLQK